jgi:hypothetical protein
MSPLPILDEKSHRLWLVSCTPQPQVLNIEPWGMTLYLQPNATYLLDATGGTAPSPTDVQVADGEFFTPESDTRLTLDVPLTVWPTGDLGNALYRDEPAFNDFKLVWESKHPGELDSTLTHPLVIELLRNFGEAESRGYPWHQHLFSEKVSNVAEHLGVLRRADLDTLLYEYGIVTHQGAVIMLTEWGRQVSRMYTTPPQEQ